MPTLTPTPTEPETASGLEGITVADTALSEVDGERGQLTIAGYSVETLAPSATFEQVACLLLEATSELPRGEVLEGFTRRLESHREISPAIGSLLDDAGARRVEPMDALRMGIAALESTDDNRETAATLVASLPTVIAHYWRRRQGKEPIAVRPELGHAAHYLYLLEGEEPAPARSRALETYLNTIVDHGLNASTFTARVILSTQSDLVSAITGAIGALKGPLHGGAPGPVLDMIEAIGTVDRAENWLRDQVASGGRLMGFGHRVYRVRDPRAEVLAAAAARLADAGENAALFDLARGIERTAVDVLAELKPGRRLDTNVEFYTALLLHSVGLPRELFSPTFAAGRVVGWLAHSLEQQRTGRLIRPRGRYVGPRNLEI